MRRTIIRWTVEEKSGAASLWAAPLLVKYGFWGLCFLYFRFTPGLPFPKLPLAFLTLIESNNIRQDTPGDVLNLVLRNAGIVDELLPASQVVKVTSDFQFL